MEVNKNYEVLKITIYSERYYMNTEQITGMTLSDWIKRNPVVKKKELFHQIESLIESLSRYHQQKGNPCYAYLNPYSVIVGEDGAWYLLDPKGEQNAELIHQLKKRCVRENFLPPDSQYYQKISVKSDVFSFGKTMQYVLANIETEPKLKKSEEHCLKKIISESLNQNSKKSYQNMIELSNHYSKLKFHEKKHEKLKTGIAFAVSIALAVLAGIYGGKYYFLHDTEDLQSQVSIVSEQKLEEQVNERIAMEEKQWEEEKEAILETSYQEKKGLLYDLALLCFKDARYVLCKEYLEDLQERDSFAQGLAQLCDYFEGLITFDNERRLEMLLAEMEENIPDPEDKRLYYCLLQGYMEVDNDEAAEERKRLSEECLSSDLWISWAGDEIVSRVEMLRDHKGTLEKEPEEKSE